MAVVKMIHALFLFVALMTPGIVMAESPAFPDGAMSAESVIQQFAGEDEVSAERRIDTERKHQILFLMGISLLVLLLLTGTMGVAMAAFGKDVFVAHMILAGLSLTLAAVHSVTAIVWFWPY